MVVNRGGLLAGVATAALGGLGFGGFVDPNICSIEAEGGAEGGGGGGGAAEASAEDDDFFGGEGGEAKAGEGGEAKAGEGGEAKAGEGGEAKAGEEAQPAEWMKSFSGEKKDGELSNQEWLAKIGAKDVDDVVGRYRELEKAHRASGKVKVPGEGASEAEVKAFREAIGAPEEAAGYVVELPQGADKFEIDSAFLDPMKAIALKHNVSAAAFKELGDAFMAGQLQSVTEEAATHNQAKADTLKAWGPQADQGKEEFRRGMSVLGLKTADVQRIQRGYGTPETMNLLRKIGQMAGEDFFAGNGGNAAQRFGVTNADEAQKAIDTMIADKETAEKIRKKDPVTVARYNRLTDALAHFKERAKAAQ